MTTLGSTVAIVRPARTTDVRAIRELVDAYSSDGRLLSKATVTLFEDVPEFLVAEIDGLVVGCGAVHVMWEDLAEVRTLAVDPKYVGRGIGSTILIALMDRARALGVTRVFCLTFMVRFFASHGFHEIDDTPVDTAVYEQLLQSYDEGVAEFLGLERVKPNTLGNHRMLAIL
ncbi:MAG: amino-acid N-acetyltransferase [Actinobacteria bacterium]|nr:amino-acid N-acetyltransferase [Actinomycetota bacterium]